MRAIILTRSEAVEFCRVLNKALGLPRKPTQVGRGPHHDPGDVPGPGWTLDAVHPIRAKDGRLAVLLTPKVEEWLATMQGRLDATERAFLAQRGAVEFFSSEWSDVTDDGEPRFTEDTTVSRDARGAEARDR